MNIVQRGIAELLDDVSYEDCERYVNNEDKNLSIMTAKEYAKQIFLSKHNNLIVLNEYNIDFELPLMKVREDKAILENGFNLYSVNSRHFGFVVINDDYIWSKTKTHPTMCDEYNAKHGTNVIREYDSKTNTEKVAIGYGYFTDEGKCGIIALGSMTNYTVAELINVLRPHLDMIFVIDECGSDVIERIANKRLIPRRFTVIRIK